MDEQRIREACHFAQSLGWRVCDGVWLDERGKHCCPLGALWLTSREAAEIAREDGPCPEALLADVLGSTAEEVEWFCLGFDGVSEVFKGHATAAEVDAYWMGRSLRADLLGEEEETIGRSGERARFAPGSLSVGSAA